MGMKIKQIGNIKYRTTLIFLVSTISIVVTFIILFYSSTEKIIHDDYFATLKMKNDVVAHLYLNKQTEEPNSIIDYSALDSSHVLQPNDHNFIFPVNQYNIATISDSLEVPQTFIQQSLQRGYATFQNDNLQYVSTSYQSKLGKFIVISYAENYFNKHVQSQLQNILIICFLVSIILTMCLSLYLSRSLFKPITKITNKVKAISSQNLHLRLEEEKHNPELNQLIQTFNQMLNRMETSFETQNNFISNASHELRTPLTSIMGFADVSLSKPRSTEEYIETLKIILTESEKLDKKTRALLSLAQTGFNGKIQKFEPVRIDELIWDCIETAKTLQPNVKINFDITLLPSNSAKLVVNGNAQLLILAFTNIISNAYKYSDNKLVTVSIAATHTHIITVIRDLGIGIPKSEIPYIYDPFYRCANSKKYEGYGIGLPLTRNILAMHNGHILIDSSENVGTIVEVRLPIMQA